MFSWSGSKVHHVDIEDLLLAGVLFGSLQVHAEVSEKEYLTVVSVVYL